MAKVSSLINFRGTFGDLTFVQSTHYGNHVRARRGSKSPAPINDALRASTEIMKNANIYAKVVKDAVDPYRAVKDGTLWQRLVKFFRDALSLHSRVDFFNLKGFQLSQKGLRDVLNNCELRIVKEDALQMSIAYGDPKFDRGTGATHYELTAIVLFYKDDLTFLTSSHDGIQRVPGADAYSNTFSCSFERPHQASVAVVVLRCWAMQGHSRSMGASGFAMEVADVVDVRNYCNDVEL
jgi:hypothetical protein